MGAYADNLKENARFGDLTDVYNYVSYDTSGSTPAKAASGTAAVLGPYGENLIEVELLSNANPDERFLPGTKVYVDKTADFDSGELIPVKDSSGQPIGAGYSVLLTAKREASVEEELWMLKQRVSALENA